MRKLLTLIIAPILLITGLQAQTTPTQADAIVLERMSEETRPYSIYAKDILQLAGSVLTTAAGEEMKIEYEHWLYFVSFTDNPQGNRYCIVKETGSGYLLEAIVNNDNGPDDLEIWRLVNHTHYPNLQGTSWKLAGIMDEETGILTELEPIECEKCYRINFNSNGSFNGSAVNIGFFSICYTVNYALSTLQFYKGIVHPDMVDIYDGNIFIIKFVYEFQKLGQFKLTETKLKLYYNDKKNYLLYKKIQP